MTIKRDKVIYYHIVKSEFILDGIAYKVGQIVYIGSGNKYRHKAKVNRCKKHLSMWDKIDFEIVLQGLTSKEAEKYEQVMITKYWGKNLLNKRKTVDVKKDYIYELLDKVFYLDAQYNLRWKEDRYGGCKNKTIIIAKDSIAGYQSKNYRMVSLNRVNYQAHRIIWSLYNKSDVNHTLVVDHIDRNSLNNHPLNLRVCSHSENQKNKVYKNKTTGIRFISYFAKGKYFQVQMTVKNLKDETEKVGKVFRIIHLIKLGSSFEDAYNFQLENAKNFVETQIHRTSVPF